MPKRKKKSAAKKTVRRTYSFPDPELPQLIRTAAEADAEPGCDPNDSAFVRKAVRNQLKRQGIKSKRVLNA